MSKHEKLVRRFASKPKDFTWDELVTLMAAFGIELHTSDGSARRFVNPPTKQTFFTHRPHPSNILKPYQLQQATKFLKQERFLP